MRIDANLSDLFFARDLSGAYAPPTREGYFAGYDEAKLRAEAETLLANLERLGVTPLPSVEELIEDFYGRL